MGPSIKIRWEEGSEGACGLSCSQKISTDPFSRKLCLVQTNYSAQPSLSWFLVNSNQILIVVDITTEEGGLIEMFYLIFLISDLFSQFLDFPGALFNFSLNGRSFFLTSR